jgi:quercetin dioxygenase-like cupin family protein
MTLNSGSVNLSEPFPLANLVNYEKGRVVSRTFAQTEAIGMTLFAFDKGEGLSTHAAVGDGMVQVLDEKVLLTIGGKEVVAKAGEGVVMPANIPHAVDAVKRLKMLLTVVKAPRKKTRK